MEDYIWENMGEWSMDRLDMCFNVKIIYKWTFYWDTPPKMEAVAGKILEPNGELTRKSPKKVATIHS